MQISRLYFTSQFNNYTKSHSNSQYILTNIVHLFAIMARYSIIEVFCGHLVLNYVGSFIGAVEFNNFKYHSEQNPLNSFIFQPMTNVTKG